MTAESTLQTTIDQAWVQANNMIAAAQGYSDTALTLASGIIIPGAFHTITAPTEPLLGSAPTDTDAQFTNEYNASLAQLESLLDTRLNQFLADYYPDYTAKLDTISDWIDNTIKNGGTGLPPAIENAIWDRARSREDRTALRSESEIFDTFSARGFPIPPGAAAAMLKELQQANKDSANSLSRDIAIKQAEFELENIRFAVQTGASLHIAVISAATNYMNSIVSVAANATAKASSLVNSITSLHQVTLGYQQAAIATENLTLKYDTIAYERDRAQGTLDVEAYTNRAETKVNAALAAAKQMGSIAAAAIGSQNTMATISNNTEQ